MTSDQASGMTTTVQTLLSDLSLPVNEIRPQVARDSLETALDCLTADSIIDEWHYVATNAPLPLKQWLPIWMSWQLTVTVGPLARTSLGEQLPALLSAPDLTRNRGVTTHRIILVSTGRPIVERQSWRDSRSVHAMLRWVVCAGYLVCGLSRVRVHSCARSLARAKGYGTPYTTLPLYDQKATEPPTQRLRNPLHNFASL